MKESIRSQDQITDAQSRLEELSRRLAGYLKIETPKVDLINSLGLRYPLLLAREGLWATHNMIPPEISMENHFCSLAYAALERRRSG